MQFLMAKQNTHILAIIGSHNCESFFQVINWILISNRIIIHLLPSLKTCLVLCVCVFLKIPFCKKLNSRKGMPSYLPHLSLKDQDQILELDLTRN